MTGVISGLIRFGERAAPRDGYWGDGDEGGGAGAGDGGHGGGSFLHLSLPPFFFLAESVKETPC